MVQSIRKKKKAMHAAAKKQVTYNKTPIEDDYVLGDVLGTYVICARLTVYVLIRHFFDVRANININSVRQR